MQVIDKKGFPLREFSVNVPGTHYESLGTFVGKYPFLCQGSINGWFGIVAGLAGKRDERCGTVIGKDPKYSKTTGERLKLFSPVV